MTKKHYIQFASIFSRMLNKATNGSNRLLTRDDMIDCIARCADVLQSDNPAFDREKFIKACGKYEKRELSDAERFSFNCDPEAWKK